MIWFVAMLLAMPIGWGVGAVIVSRRIAQREARERRVWALYLAAVHRYGYWQAAHLEATTLEQLAYIWGPNGAGLILRAVE